jgi:hypothetical protein
VIARWNGTDWKRVSSPSPSSGGFLYSVVVASAHTAWAVGYNGLSSSLILRWNGTAWK